MTTTTTYGTWVSQIDTYSLDPGASIYQALESAPADWFQRMQDSGALTAIETEYRAAINDALPAGVSLHGDEFIGPAYETDQSWDGDLDIRAIVEQVDLWAIIERYDVDMA